MNNFFFYHPFSLEGLGFIKVWKIVSSIILCIIKIEYFVLTKICYRKMPVHVIKCTDKYIKDTFLTHFDCIF